MNGVAEGLGLGVMNGPAEGVVVLVEAGAEEEQE